MKLGLPLGLLGLLAIAILLLIYILKPKYQEQSVSSTYVWRLSLKYKKAKLPFQWLKSSLLLILQLTILIMISASLARPFIVLDSKSSEKIIILEASASMLAEDAGGTTRFDRAVNEIIKLCDQIDGKERITVILADDSAKYLVRRESSTGFIKQHVLSSVCAFVAPDLDGAINLAQSVLNENPSSEIVLYTARKYNDSGNIIVKNMAASEWNAAILNFSSERVNGYFNFTANIAVYGKNIDKLAVAFYIDGLLIDTSFITCKDEKATSVVFRHTKKVSYSNAHIILEANDSFLYDNSFYLFDGDADKFKVQLVSDTPYLLRTILNVIGKTKIDEIRATPEDIGGVTVYPPDPKYSGYDLYIFHGYTPLILPNDGAVWIIAPQIHTVIEGSGETDNHLVFGGEDFVSSDSTLSAAGEGTLSDTYLQIMDEISATDITISRYVALESYGGYERLLNYDNHPVLLTKTDNGVKIIVFAFDYHDSNLPITIFWPALINNLSNYSLRNTTMNHIYDAGSKVELNARPGTTHMKLNTADEQSQQFTQFPASINVEYPGIYTVEQTPENYAKTDNFFVRVPESESNFGRNGGTLKQVFAISNPSIDSTLDNETYDIMIYLVAALALILAIEWGVQYREQY